MQAVEGGFVEGGSLHDAAGGELVDGHLDEADLWMSQDSDLTAAGYSRGELDAAAVSLALNYRLIEKQRWAVWGELDVGGGAAELRTVNTPTGESTTARYYEGDFLLANAQVGVAWRLNPLVSLYGSGSWRFASSDRLEEGGQESAVEFDPSGIGVQVGLGVNY